MRMSDSRTPPGGNWRRRPGVTVADLEQLYTAGDPGRDPRGWTVSVAYLAQVEPDGAEACGS